MSEIVTAIEQGGVAQAGLMGKVSASGSLRYISAPNSVSISAH